MSSLLIIVINCLSIYISLHSSHSILIGLLISIFASITISVIYCYITTIILVDSSISAIMPFNF